MACHVPFAHPAVGFDELPAMRFQLLKDDHEFVSGMAASAVVVHISSCFRIFGGRLKRDDVIKTRIGNELILAIDAEFLSEQVALDQDGQAVSPLAWHPAVLRVVLINKVTLDHVSVFDFSNIHVLFYWLKVDKFRWPCFA
jgi:hypothetical protein